jgi:hypothetical protein
MDGGNEAAAETERKKGNTPMTTTTTATKTVRFSRTSQDGATETLTLVRLPASVYCESLGREVDLGVQVTAGDEGAEEVVAVYDLDGDAPRFSWSEVELVNESEVPADVVAEVADWDRGGTCTVKRLAA